MTEAIERLQSPFASETWSALAALPLLVVDASIGAPSPPASAGTAALAVLAALPCPSVVLVPPAAPLDARLDGFDVVVANEDELALVAAAVMRNPLAAATLVQVLRASAGLGSAEALTVESLGYATLQAGPEHARWLAARPAPALIAGSAEPVVRLHHEADMLVVTLDRPARHNAFSARMRDELVAALALAVLQPELGVVLRGAGPSFCSGGDLDEFGTRPDPATAHLVRTARSPARLLAAIGARVRAEVHGACIGAGLELAAFARRVVARPDAIFALPEVAMGLIPGAGGTVSLPRRIGRQRTAWLALTGRRLDAATARAWGVVDAIAADAVC